MHFPSALKEAGECPSGDACFVKVVPSDHSSLEILRKVKMHAIVRSHFGCESSRITGSGKWLLNYARNANKRTPVESVITMMKLNAPRPRQSIRLPKRLRSHQRKKKIEGPYDPEQLSGRVVVAGCANLPAEYVIQGGGRCCRSR